MAHENKQRENADVALERVQNFFIGSGIKLQNKNYNKNTRTHMNSIAQGQGLPYFLCFRTPATQFINQNHIIFTSKSKIYHYQIAVTVAFLKNWIDFRSRSRAKKLYRILCTLLFQKMYPILFPILYGTFSRFFSCQKL